MEINYITKYELGQALFYLKEGTIKKAHIVGIRCTFKEGDYYNNSSLFEEFFVIREEDNTQQALTAKCIAKKYFLSKTDILKHIADQI